MVRSKDGKDGKECTFLGTPNPHKYQEGRGQILAVADLVEGEVMYTTC